MEYEYTYDVTSDKAAGPFVTPDKFGLRAGNLGLREYICEQ